MMRSSLSGGRHPVARAAGRSGSALFGTQFPHLADLSVSVSISEQVCKSSS